MMDVIDCRSSLPRRTILLVTGARLLATTPGAEDWAKAILTEELLELNERCVVLTGRAKGPDTWTREVVAAHVADHPMRLVTYDGDGLRHDYAAGATVPRVGRWAEEKDLPASWRERFLLRDRRMVEGLGEALGGGWADGATCLAFFHPDSTTHGTAYTVDRFEQTTDYTRTRKETWRG